MSSSETWLVLGASSAIAREFARAAAHHGADIVLAGRDRTDLEASAADISARTGRRTEIIDFDVATLDSHARVLEQAAAFAGAGTLNLFFAVGSMPTQEALDTDPSRLRGVIDANYTGAVHFLQVAAPLFEAHKAGRIAVLGSVAGDRGRLRNYVYGSAKAGLHAYLQGLRARLWRSGVTVTTIKPGPVDTAMTFGLPNLPLLAQPDVVAAACLDAALRGAEEVYVPAPWWLIMAILRAIPERIFKRLNI